MSRKPHEYHLTDRGGALHDRAWSLNVALRRMVEISGATNKTIYCRDHEDGDRVIARGFQNEAHFEEAA